MVSGLQEKHVNLQNEICLTINHSFTVPGAVSDMGAGTTTSESIELIWDEPMIGGLARNINGYQVIWQGPDSGIIETTELQANISGLSPNNLYNFQVVTEYSDGHTTLSRTFSFATG